METLLINTILAVLIGVIPYLVKYKKKYNLISGNTDYKEGNVTETDAIKQKANLLSNYIFLFCGLLIFLPILLLFIPFESSELKLHKDGFTRTLHYCTVGFIVMDCLCLT